MHLSIIKNRKALIAGLLLLLTLSIFSHTTFAGQATEVHIGLKIEQITGINQKQKNFAAVAALRVNWTDPRLAFTPEPGETGHRTYTLPTLLKLLESKNIRWPAISYSNQQGRTAFESQVAQISRDGTVKYMERFTATFQAPDFNFRLFPLDRQKFFIDVDSIFPEQDFVFRELPGFSGMGPALGVEEWIILEVRTEVTVQNHSGFDPGSRFTLIFEAERHLNYYIIRILIPVLLIITVSWFSFFLQDYAKRIDLAGANLLLFIAFNFTISNDMPRLGYITLIDTFLVSTFIVTGLVILANVMLRRLENHGRRDLARKLDVYAIIGYPLAYLIGAIVLSILFS